MGYSMHLEEFAPAIPKAVGKGLAALGGRAGSTMHHHGEGGFQIAREEIDRRLGQVCQAQAARWLRPIAKSLY